MTTSQNDLLSLLRIFINGSSSEQCTVGADTDWRAVLRLASEQAVVGVTLGAVLQLPPEVRPVATTIAQLGLAANSIMQRNAKMNRAVKSLVEEFDEAGIEGVFMKGQVAAVEYGRGAMLRQSGDIDMFFDETNWLRVTQWLSEQHIAIDTADSEKHIVIKRHEARTELHVHAHKFSSSKANRYWMREIEHRAVEQSRTVDVDGAKVRTLGVTEALVHLLVHTHTHLTYTGVGLRQVMDLTLFLRNHHAEIDTERLMQHLRGIGHTKAFSAYCALMQKHLHLPAECIPVALTASDFAYADKILGCIWRSGNFGYKHKAHNSRHTIVRYIYSASHIIATSIRFYALAPAEARLLLWHVISLHLKAKLSPTP